jgi:O-antigen polymerase
MQKTVVLFQYILFALSTFVISSHFANPPAPTLYIAAGGCFVLAIAAIILKSKQQIFRLSITEVLFGGFLLFVVVNGVSSKSLNPEWLISGLSLGLFYLAVKRTEQTTEWLFAGLVFIGMAQAVYGLGQYVHWFSNIAASGFRMSGSFDNPAGFAAALSVCFPFALFLVSKKKIYWRLIGGVAAVLFIVAVVLSQSRAGVLAIIVIIVIWTIKRFNVKWLNDCTKRTKIVGSGILVIAILVGLYFVKKDSADGRLLIWKCSTNMILDRPLLGHGVGSFQRDYMLYQADYFRNHPATSSAMLADIVKHPFNEFLLILVEHGLVGGLLLGIFVFILIREYNRNKSLERFYAMLCLVGMGIFACFSYPLSYPFVKLIAVFCAAFIMQNEAVKWNIPKGIFSVLKPAVLIVSVALLVLTVKMYQDEYYWNTIAQRSLAGETRKVLPDYARLYPWMNRNGLFVYNYAAELNYIGEWKQSNKLMTECSGLYNDNDVQLILADNCQQQKQYAEAEEHLKLAYEMIPNRFIPLYRLALLYKKEGKINKANQIARMIVTKPVKIMSGDVLSIKSEMKELVGINNKTQPK